jgi:Heterokaryon incompatibility protein (HET)
MIHLEGQELETGENAHAAFVRLRKPSNSRTLWIGAISINQEELAERGNLVAQMRYICGCAERVLVWLGDTPRGTDPMRSLQTRIFSLGNNLALWIIQK